MKNLKELQQIFDYKEINKEYLQFYNNGFTINVFIRKDYYLISIEDGIGIVFADFVETVEEVYSLVLACEYDCTNEFNNLIN